MRGVLKAVLTGSAIAKDPKLQPLLPRLVSGVYVTKATSEDDGNDDLRSIDIEVIRCLTAQASALLSRS